MIRIVTDANVLLSGMIGHYNGPSRRVINLALAKKILIYGSKETYEEFCEKIKIPRFKKYLQKRLFTPEKMILDYKSFVNMSEPTIPANVKISRDPDDDIYFHTAQNCNAKVVITGDKDLLSVGKYAGIIAVTPAKFINSFEKLNQG